MDLSPADTYIHFVLQAASPAVSLSPLPGQLTSPSLRRISRRDKDLGLPATGLAAAAAVSPASLASPPYNGSSDEEAERMEENDEGADEGDEELSEVGTPEVQLLHDSNGTI